MLLVKNYKSALCSYKVYTYYDIHDLKYYISDNSIYQLVYIYR